VASAQCKHKGCTKEALFKSDFCWEHIQDKEKYKKRILQSGKYGKILLRGANLEEAKLGGVLLKEAVLEGANLGGAHLEEANLEGTVLWGATLRRANLARASLVKASLIKANLWAANFRRANFKEADLEGANLVGARLERADIRNADLRGANLRVVDLYEANLERARLEGAILIGANLSKANLGNADLRNSNLNNADLFGADLTGANVWGMSHAGCKTDGIKAEYLNFDKGGNESGIVRLNKEQAEEFFRWQPTIQILLQNRLPPCAIRTLLDLIDKVNEQNPDWAVEFRKLTSSNFFSELTVKASRDEILEQVANVILGAFKKGYQQKLLEYLPDKKAVKKYDLILRELGEIKHKIQNPIQQVTLIRGTGEIPVNINFQVSKVRDIKIFGDVGKMINVEGNYYEISDPQEREDLIRNLIDQLDSPEIEKRIKEAEGQLKGLSTGQVKFLEEQFRKSVEKIFKEKQKEVGFFDKVKAFSQRFSESTFSSVIGNAIWFGIQKFALTSM